MQVEGHHGEQSLVATGGRVRNTCATYLQLRDTPLKGGLIPHTADISHDIFVKDLLVVDGHAQH